MAKKPSLKAALGRVQTKQSQILQAEKKEERIKAAESAAHKRSKSKAKKIMPFEEDDTILLLGEANFSFTLALLEAHPPLDPSAQVVATSYDSEETCCLKYPDAEGILAKIRAKGVPVLFEVDAGNLEKNEVIRSRIGGFSRVVFNFPHVGLGEKSQSRNVALNQALILRFLRSVVPFLSQGPSRAPERAGASKKGRGRGKGKGRAGSPGGMDDDDGLEGVSDLEDETMEDDEGGLSGRSTSTVVKRQKGTVLVTLRDAVPYTLWDLPHLFTKPSPPPPLSSLPPDQRPPPNTLLPPTQPRYRIIRSFAFHSVLYPGYSHRRTIGFKDGLSKGANEEIEERGGGRTWEAEVVDASLFPEAGDVDEEGRTKEQRIEERRRELRAEKKKGNGWKDKRPAWSAPQEDGGWKSK